MKLKISLANLLMGFLVVAIAIAWYVERNRREAKPRFFSRLSVGQGVRVYKDESGYRLGVSADPSRTPPGSIIEINSDFIRVKEVYRRGENVTEIVRTIPRSAILAIEETTATKQPKQAQAVIPK